MTRIGFYHSDIPGLLRLSLVPFADQRGNFVKLYSQSMFAEAGLDFPVQENYFSFSKRGVIRGMHFQTPPHDHDKLVFCLGGEILDAVLDLRAGSPTYGRHQAFLLSASAPQALYIPRGCAHGFASRQDHSCVVYLQTTGHSAEHDTGILWNSFGMDWNVSDPIVSARDAAFPSLGAFRTPFAYDGA